MAIGLPFRQLYNTVDTLVVGRYGAHDQKGLNRALRGVGDVTIHSLLRKRPAFERGYPGPLMQGCYIIP